MHYAQFVCTYCTTWHIITTYPSILRHLLVPTNDLHDCLDLISPSFPHTMDFLPVLQSTSLRFRNCFGNPMKHNLWEIQGQNRPFFYYHLERTTTLREMLTRNCTHTHAYCKTHDLLNGNSYCHAFRWKTAIERFLILQDAQRRKGYRHFCHTSPPEKAST